MAPDFLRTQYHAFEFVTADRDTAHFHAHVSGDAILGSHLLFEERDRGDIVLGRVGLGPAAVRPRLRGARQGTARSGVPLSSLVRRGPS